MTYEQRPEIVTLAEIARYIIKWSPIAPLSGLKALPVVICFDCDARSFFYDQGKQLLLLPVRPTNERLLQHVNMAKKKAPMLTNVDDMDNEGRVRLLAVIDNLRALGINDNVSLPQV